MGNKVSLSGKYNFYSKIVVDLTARNLANHDYLLLLFSLNIK